MEEKTRTHRWTRTWTRTLQDPHRRIPLLQQRALPTTPLSDPHLPIKYQLLRLKKRSSSESIPLSPTPNPPSPRHRLPFFQRRTSFPQHHLKLLSPQQPLSSSSNWRDFQLRRFLPLPALLSPNRHHSIHSRTPPSFPSLNPSPPTSSKNPKPRNDRGSVCDALDESRRFQTPARISLSC